MVLSWNENNLHKIVTYSHTWICELNSQTCHIIILKLLPLSSTSPSHMLFIPLILHSCLIFCLHFIFSGLFLLFCPLSPASPSRHLLGTPLPSSPQYPQQEKLDPEMEAQSSLHLPNSVAAMSPSHFLMFYCLSFSPAPQVAFVQSFLNSFSLRLHCDFTSKNISEAKQLIRKGKRTSVPVR